MVSLGRQLGKVFWGFGSRGWNINHGDDSFGSFLLVAAVEKMKPKGFDGSGVVLWPLSHHYPVHLAAFNTATSSGSHGKNFNAKVATLKWHSWLYLEAIMAEKAIVVFVMMVVVDPY